MEDETKQARDFRVILNNVNNLIKNRKFKDAIRHYHNLHRYFESLPLIRREKFKRDVNLIYNELIVYMDVNEAYLLAKEGNIVLLKHKLEHIYELSIDLWNVKDASELMKYVSKRYRYCLGVYVYKVSLMEFAKKYAEAKNLINERKFDKAIKVYCRLLVYYNNLLKYEKNEKIRLDLYNEMKELYLDLSRKKSVNDAYGNRNLEFVV